MKTKHLKNNQIRAHLANSDGIHSSGKWSECPSCSQVYNATMSKRERAIVYYRRNPSELVPVRTVYDEVVYISREDNEKRKSHDFHHFIRFYKRNGDPYLCQRNREADYLPEALHPYNICDHDRATWKSLTFTWGKAADYCPICYGQPEEG